MKKIIALGASNSKESINKSFAHHVAGKLTNVEVELLDLNDFDMPMFGVDLEDAEGIPSAAVELKEKIKSCHGIVLSLAEHNGSFTAGFKSAVDWVSRLDGKIWEEKPMLLLSSSPGNRGGKSVMKTAKEIYPYQGAEIIADFSLPTFDDNFGDDGIKDKWLKDELNIKIEIFNKYLKDN